jgi:hypothetical protein
VQCGNKTSRCFDCPVVVQSFLCERCNRQRKVEDRFDRSYAAWKEQLPGKTYRQWLAQRGREIETKRKEIKGGGREWELGDPLKYLL